MASQAGGKDTSTHSPHTISIKGELTSPDCTSHVVDPATSAPTCHSQPQALPTWSADNELSWQEMRTCGEPRQQHVHHHHHHHYYQYQWPAAAACSCSSGGLSSSTSPSLACGQADPLQLVTAHTHYPLALKSTHTQHTHTITENTHTTYQHKEHTHITPSPFHTHIAPFHPSIQKVPTKETDLYAIRPLPVKKPRRPRRSQSKLLPPFPSPSTPPYIICQHCSQLLSLPSTPRLHMTHASVLKLKCALCMGISLFSTRPQHTLSSSKGRVATSESAHPEERIAVSESAHPERRIAISESAENNITGGDFQFKVDHRSINADLPSIDLSTDGGSHLTVDERRKNTDVPGVHSLTGSGFQLNVEEGSMHTHVPTMDTSHKSAPINDTPTKGTCVPHREESPHSSSKLNPEFAGFSSVQDWVNSLEQESFLHCPTPVIGAGFGSDLQLQGPLDWHMGGEYESENFVPPVPGSPLHEHFGYKTPTELLIKPLSSDDEIKARSDTNSSASTSATSAHTFKPPGFDNAGESPRPNERVPAAARQSSKSRTRGTTQVAEGEQSSLVNLFKRSLKSFGERKSPSMSSTKSRVIVNGHALSDKALKGAEKQAGKLRPGSYWYDSNAGFWGITGGPCLGVLPPFIEDLHHPMAGDCSNGDTQVFVNGRELHHIDLALLAHRGLSRKPGRAYAISFDGVVIEETSGQELKHLGKLAPTVERRGKGFGMYMAKSQS